MVLRFELRALHLLGRCSNLPYLQLLLALVIFQLESQVFAWTILSLYPPPSQLAG
jgi:hypothetical protein